ncbi:MAG TPA: chromosome segregation protein SMC, partial [Rubricoccaceae bacterium]
KSFAHKTSVAFSPGVTAIVGPNGCGKSNVIDAVRWVLGEQRARLLRSDAMSGVIFNGAEGRRPLGMAEVSLTVENTRGVLPTEYTEVTITRRLYRNGDSDYLLNGTVCRLRDVLDLFMDTGMGAGAYSVIELSMVEDILSENAADRRRLFEEAAGVTKYKRRREQTVKRLAATQTDLTRLDDIVEEVEKQVRTLERQAGKARTHARLSEQLRRFELALAAHDWARLQAEREARTAESRTAGDAAEAHGAQLATGEAALEADRATLVGAETALSERSAALAAHADRVRGLDAERRVEAERAAGATRALDRLATEAAEASARRAGLARDAALTAERLATAEADLAAETAAVAAADAIRTQAVQAETARRTALDAARTAASETARTAADARAARDRTRDRRASMEAEIARIHATEAELDARTAPATGPDALGDAVARADADLAAAAQGLAEQTAARDAARTAEAAAREAEQAARSAHDAARAEASLLDALLGSGEGDDEAIGVLRNVLPVVTVAEAVGCDDADRPALAAALGLYATAIVVSTDAEADAALATLRDADAGRATFLVLDRVVARSPAERSPTPHGATPAPSLARTADPTLVPLVRALLADVFVVDTLADARRLSAQYPIARFIARDGSWATPAGAVHGGADGPGAGASRVGLRERQAGAAEALGQATDALDAALARSSEARTAVARAETGRQQAEARRDAARSALDLARTAVARRDATAAALTGERARLAARLAEVTAQIAALPPDRALDEAAATASAAADLAESARDAARRALDAAETVRRSAEAAWNDARLALTRATAAVATLRADRDRIAGSVAALERRDAARGDEHARLTEAFTLASGREADLARALDTERTQTDALQGAAAEAETHVLDARARIADAEAGLRTVRAARETALAARAAASLRLAEIATRQQTTEERLADDHGATLADAEREFDRLVSEGDFHPDAARADVPRLREKIRALGAVNALALESFDEENERLTFLQAQRADVQSAERSLLDTIDEINRTASERFNATFTQIRDAFQTIFADLFGGDAEADVVLDGDDPLESPVAITARPRGKRPVGLAQLSGGEKTLTATALLFAIYLVKPSPFCILDEVDAPLDDANVDRFMRLIRSFADRTQFILVTHNKLTMEAADRMYGVTMPTPGVSRLVGVRLDGVDVAEPGAAQPGGTAEPAARAEA